MIKAILAYIWLFIVHTYSTTIRFNKKTIKSIESNSKKERVEANLKHFEVKIP